MLSETSGRRQCVQVDTPRAGPAACRCAGPARGDSPAPWARPGRPGRALPGGGPRRRARFRGTVPAPAGDRGPDSDDSHRLLRCRGIPSRCSALVTARKAFVSPRGRRAPAGSGHRRPAPPGPECKTPSIIRTGIASGAARGGRCDGAEAAVRHRALSRFRRGKWRGRPLGPRLPAARRTTPAMPPAPRSQVPGEGHRRRGAESPAGSGGIVPPVGGRRESTPRGGTRPRRGAREWHVEGVAQPPARVTPDADGGRAPR